MLMNYITRAKISLRDFGSYIDSPEWVKSQKPTINSQNNNDGNCSQYAVTIALNHEKI